MGQDGSHREPGSLLHRDSRKPTMLQRVSCPPFSGRSRDGGASFASSRRPSQACPHRQVPIVAVIAPLARLRPFRGAPFQQDRCRQHDAGWCARRRTNSGGTCKSSLRRASASSARSTAWPPTTGCRNRLRSISFGGCTPRQGDSDGRGNLSHRALNDFVLCFCAFARIRFSGADGPTGAQ